MSQGSKNTAAVEKAASIKELQLRIKNERKLSSYIGIQRVNLVEQEGLLHKKKATDEPKVKIPTQSPDLAQIIAIEAHQEV